MVVEDRIVSVLPNQLRLATARPEVWMRENNVPVSTVYLYRSCSQYPVVDPGDEDLKLYDCPELGGILNEIFTRLKYFCVRYAATYLPCLDSARARRPGTVQGRVHHRRVRHFERLAMHRSRRKERRGNVHPYRG